MRRKECKNKAGAASGRVRIQLRVAVGLVVVGCILLGGAFVTPPRGEVHSSVLVAFGEILTFAGALFGIDYHYRTRSMNS